MIDIPNLIGSVFVLDDLNGKKFVVSKIIEGGFGKVYFLLDKHQKPGLVLKLFKKNNDIENSTREALLWSSLGYHENIAEYILAGEYKGSFYILARRYSRTLAEMDYNELSDDSIKNILFSIVNGLKFGYEKIGLIHRDIKPNNIFLDLQNTVKIGDFGISTYIKEKYILSNNLNEIETIEDVSKRSIGGTIPFMAPELFNKDYVYSLSTDIYSIGITLFVILTNGLLPYKIPDFTINTEASKTFDNLNINNKLKNIILKSIKLEERYSDYNDILNDLELRDNYYLNNNKNDLDDKLKYVSTLVKSEQVTKARFILSGLMQKYKDHPTVLYSIAYLEEDVKEYEKGLCNIIFNEWVYDKKLYFTPLFDLANLYVYSKRIKMVVALIDKYKSYLIDDIEYIEREYKEYCLYLALTDKSFDTFEKFCFYIMNNKVPDLYILLFLQFAISINKLEDAKSIIADLKTSTSKYFIDKIFVLDNQSIIKEIDRQVVETFGENI